MDVIDVDSELKNETSRFFQEKLHDDVVNIIQQWKLNNIDLDNQFKGRTYTKAKRKMNLFDNEQNNGNSINKISNLNMEIGGLVTNNEKNCLLNVSPPNSIFSSNSLMDNSMGNSLITSMDFNDINAFDNSEQIDEEYFTMNLKNLKEKFGNNSKTNHDYNNSNDLNTSFELNEKYLTINLKKDRPAISIPSCSSEDFTSDDVIDSSPSPILDDDDDDDDDNNKTKILHNHSNLQNNTYNLLNNCLNETLTLNKDGDPFINCTFDKTMNNIENMTFIQSTPLRNQNIDIIMKIEDELELSPVSRNVLSIPKTIEKIKNRYSINNGSLEKPVQQINENKKDFNTYSVKNGRLLAKRNRMYEVQDIDMNEIEKEQNIINNIIKDKDNNIKSDNENLVENLSQDNGNVINITLNYNHDENLIKDELESKEITGKNLKLSLLKRRIPRDLSADRSLTYTKTSIQKFCGNDSRLKKPINKDLINIVQENQFYRQTDNNGGASNNIQRASSASDIALDKRTENAQQNLEIKSKSFKNLSSNVNQGYRKSNLIAPTKINYRGDSNNFAVPNPVRKTSQCSGIPQRPLQTNDIVRPNSTPTAVLNGKGKLQIPQPSRIKRSGLPRPSKLH